MLSCSCDYDYDAEPGMWLYSGDHSWFVPLDTDIRKRCISCAELIGVGALCIKHPRYRYPHNDIEARIVGANPDLNEEPPIRMADHYQCESCGEIWLNLTAIGYDCLLPIESMTDSLKEYHDLTGFNKNYHNQPLE